VKLVNQARDPDVRGATVAVLTRWIFTAVALGMTAFYAVVTVGPLAAVEITGDEGFSGLPTAFSVLGTAAGSAVLSSIMARRGRRAGSLLGLLIAISGAATALAGMSSRSIVVLIAGMFLMGSGNATNQLARYAGAEMHAVERRASVISWIVWAGAIGAVMGPSLVPLFRPLARALHFDEVAGGFLVAVLFFLAAALTYAVAIRTDPSKLAIAADPQPQTTPSVDDGSAARAIVVSVVVLVASQSAMVLIMTVTPLQVSRAHHGVGAVSLVMGSHLFGMFGLAPIVGRLVDRLGSLRVIRAGAVLIAVAAALAGLMPASSGPLLAAPLFLLGLGWSLGFVAGSALLSKGLASERGARMQGRIDTLVWGCSAAASLGSGLLIDTLGYAALSGIGIALMVPPLAIALSQRQKAIAPA
jgi:MFS family permease